MSPDSTERPDTGAPACPMATACRGLVGKPPSHLLLMIPGAVLVAAGVLILLEPRMLFWITAITSIAVGIVLLFVSSFVRRFVQRSRTSA